MKLLDLHKISGLVLVLTIFLAFLAPGSAKAESASPKKINPSFPVILSTMIDLPTAEVLDYGSFTFNSRFFGNGGLMPALVFGIFQRLTFGASIELDHYIGSGDVDVQRPELQIKFRFFDGQKHLPAAAIGYDSQGHRFDSATKKYLIEERGLYLALSKEFLIKGLELTAGGNVSDFERDSLRGFGGLSFAINQSVWTFFEYDNIRSKNITNRANAGVNFFLSQFVQMGFGVRDVFGRKTFAGSSIVRKPERIIDIRYITSF